jgi:hypothetical protein
MQSKMCAMAESRIENCSPWMAITLRLRFELTIATFSKRLSLDDAVVAQHTAKGPGFLDDIVLGHDLLDTGRFVAGEGRPANDVGESVLI